jgi:hypothetical protein
MDLIRNGSKFLARGARVGNTGLTGLGAALLALGWLRKLYRGRELLYARDLKPGDAIRIRLLDGDDEVTIEG